VVDVSGAAGPQVVFGVWDSGEFDEYAFWTGNLIIGSAFGDVICSGPYSADEVYGGGGNDRIFGENTDAFDDGLSGGAGDDEIYAGYSPEDEPAAFTTSFAEGCEGPDLSGGVGNDLLMGDDCKNYMGGGGGADEMYGEGAATACLATVATTPCLVATATRHGAVVVPTRSMVRPVPTPLWQ
jgi:Ca2+-binding RTX toxin-like protein